MMWTMQVTLSLTLICILRQNCAQAHDETVKPWLPFALHRLLSQQAIW